MPAFNPTSKFLAGVVDAIVVFLIVNWPRQAVAKHAFCERWKCAVGVLLEEFCGRGRIAFCWVYCVVDRRPKLEELVLSCCASRSAESSNAVSDLLVH